MRKSGYALSDKAYSEGYLIRKSLSTMTRKTKEWLRSNINQFFPGTENPLYVLSIGCGDGELETALLETLSIQNDVNFLGLDQNPIELDQFKNRISKFKKPYLSNAFIDIREYSFSSYSSLSKKYDLIIMSHILYSFKESRSIIKNALDHLSNNGFLFIIHQGDEGIPQIRNQLKDKYKIGEPAHTSSLIKTNLNKLGVNFRTYKIEASIDIKSIIQKTEQGRVLMSFCIMKDLAKESTQVINKISNLFITQALNNSPDIQHIYEPIDIIVATKSNQEYA